MLEKITKVDTHKNVEADLILLSDIHASELTDYNWLYKAAEEVQKRGATAIMVLGDLLNDGLDTESAKRLSDIFYEFGKTAPVIMITGNHDLVTPKQIETGERWFFIRRPEDVAILEQNISLLNSVPNAIFLRNQDTLLPGGIRVLGLDMKPSYYTNERKNNLMLCDTLLDNFGNTLDKREYNIFLSHSPINTMEQSFREKFYVFDNVDLQLAGHMHNGLLPYYLEWIIPGDKGLIGKNEGKPYLFPNLSKGKIRIANNTYGIIANPYCTISAEKKDKVKFNSLYPPVLQTVKVRKRTR